MKNIRFKYRVLAIVSLGMLFPSSCTYPDWEEHFEDLPETVNMELWDAVREESRFSSFVQIMEAYEMDSIFGKGLSYTLFIPNNDALDKLTDTAGVMVPILENHISKTVFLTRNIQQGRKIESLGGKFPLITSSPDGYCYDMIPIVFSSPLHLDGFYYELEDLAIPRPNLYEFASRYSSIIEQYIDLTDSVYIDKSLSTPIGFDSLGNTVYDSVFGVVNRFERDFFPVNQEFRNKTATFILFTQEQYDQALDEMADDLGSVFADHGDIPESWQFEVLLPYAMEGSLFDNMLEYQQFNETMVSVTGDSVFLDIANIDPISKYLCSNGYTYIYQDFNVPKDLYFGENRIEGESLIDSIGNNTFSWKPKVNVSGYLEAPLKQWTSEGSIVILNFPINYNGSFSIEFRLTNVFPARYRLEYRTSFRPSGSFSIYVNDVLLERQDKYGRTITEFDTYNLRQSVLSVDGETRFIPSGNFNKIDYYVESINDFGEVKIRFDYMGSGSGSENGFVMDYVKLVPAEQL